MATIDDLLRAASTLASPPEVVQTVLRLVEDPTTRDQDLADVLLRDASLSARVLQVVNSAQFSPAGGITTIEHAIRLLGRGSVRNITIAASFSRWFVGDSRYGPLTPAAMWRHAVAVAAAAEALSLLSRHDVDASTALVAGLLHDLGLLVASRGAPTAFAALVAALDDDTPFHDLEHAHIGADHAAIGSALAARWRFPAPIAATMRHHHEPANAADDDDAALVAIVHFADLVACDASIGSVCTAARPARQWSERQWEGADDADERLLARAGVTPDDLRSLRLSLPDAAGQLEHRLAA